MARRFLDVDPGSLRLPPSRHQGADPINMTQVRQEVLRLLADVSEHYPEWRLGQLLANVAMWARQPTEPHDSGIWDVEDEELLLAMQRHLARKEVQVGS